MLFSKTSSFYILHLIQELTVVNYCNIIENTFAPGESEEFREASSVPV